MAKISLIISTYNRPDALRLVLISVANQLTDKCLHEDDIEIIIADDGSTSETRELVNSFCSKVPFNLIHVWHEDTGFRLAAIRNLAVSKSTGAYLVFIDGDCIIPDDFLINQYQLAEKNYFVGGNRVLLSEKYTAKIIAKQDTAIVNSGIISSVLFRLIGASNKFLPVLRLNFNAKWRKKNEMNWRRPKGCNMALWRDDYYLVNGFDEAFKGWGHEDADFLVRLLHAGIRIKDGRFSVPVYHLWHKMSDRANEVNNIKLLEERIANKAFIRALEGADKYLH